MLIGRRRSIRQPQYLHKSCVESVHRSGVERTNHNTAFVAPDGNDPIDLKLRRYPQSIVSAWLDKYPPLLDIVADVAGSWTDDDMVGRRKQVGFDDHCWARLAKIAGQRNGCDVAALQSHSPGVSACSASKKAVVSSSSWAARNMAAAVTERFQNPSARISGTHIRTSRRPAAFLRSR